MKKKQKCSQGTCSNVRNPDTSGAPNTSQLVGLCSHSHCGIHSIHSHNYFSVLLHWISTPCPLLQSYRSMEVHRLHWIVLILLLLPISDNNTTSLTYCYATSSRGDSISKKSQKCHGLQSFHIPSIYIHTTDSPNDNYIFHCSSISTTLESEVPLLYLFCPSVFIYQNDNLFGLPHSKTHDQSTEDNSIPNTSA